MALMGRNRGFPPREPPRGCEGGRKEAEGHPGAGGEGRTWAHVTRFERSAMIS